MDNAKVSTKNAYIKRFRINLITLNFLSANEEATYRKKTSSRAIYLIRIYLITAILMYSLFGALDYFVAGEKLKEVWLIRFGIVVPVMILLLMSTKSKHFSFFAQYLPLIAIISAGFGIIAMTAFLPPPYNAHYYAGLIIVSVYTGTLVGTRFVFTAAATILLLGTYFIVALIVFPIPPEYLLGNTFFLMTAGAVSLLSSYLHEFNSRRAYIHQEQIEGQREHAASLLIESQSANRAKSEFLATMSHELRTPLNAICGFSEIIKDEIFGPTGKQQYTSYAKDIYQSGRHLLSIIDDILDLAKAESGKLTLDQRPTPLGPMLESCVRMCDPKVRAGRVKLTFEIDSLDRVAIMDERLIRQALLNLLSNAIKYTPEHGEVKLRVASTGDEQILFSIADNGIGIAAEDLERIRRPFEQVESAMSRNVGGTGLGLPLTEKIITLHGSVLLIESEVGVGTTTSFRLPAGHNEQTATIDRAEAS